MSHWHVRVCSACGNWVTWVKRLSSVRVKSAPILTTAVGRGALEFPHKLGHNIVILCPCEPLLTGRRCF